MVWRRDPSSSTRIDQQYFWKHHWKWSLKYVAWFVFLLLVLWATNIRTPHSRLEAYQEHDIVLSDSSDFQVWYDVCFVTAAFGDSPTNIDIIRDVPDFYLTNFSNFRYFAFTNLPDLPEKKGWTYIVQQNLTYCRDITRSRVGKFLAWKSSDVRHCRVVFYSDASSSINPTDPDETWLPLAEKVIQSPHGIMQNLNVYNPKLGGELAAIVSQKKDIESNVDRTRTWLEAQPEYHPEIPVYHNQFIGYVPSNPIYRNLTLEFWSHYSKETGSWRDQPYWAYLLYKHNITPVAFDRLKTNVLWNPDGGRGQVQHLYKEEHPRCFRGKGEK